MANNTRTRAVQGESVTLLEKWKMGQALIRNYSTATGKIALLLLDHRNSKSGRCDPSYETLAKEAGVHRRTAMRAVARLVNDGWLTRRHRHETSNSYDFNWSRTAHDGDADVTSTVTPVSLGSDASVTRGSDSRVTQILEDRNQESNQEIESINSKGVFDSAKVIPFSNSKPANATADKMAFKGEVFAVTETEFAELKAEYKYADIRDALALADCFYRNKRLPEDQREYVMRKWLSKANAEAKPKPVYGVDWF